MSTDNNSAALRRYEEAKAIADATMADAMPGLRRAAADNGDAAYLALLEAIERLAANNESFAAATLSHLLALRITDLRKSEEAARVVAMVLGAWPR